MTRYILYRLLQAVIATLGVLTIVFVVMRLAGDPTLLLAPDNASREQIEALRVALGFDRPLHVQYFAYVGDLLRLNLGESVVQRAPAIDILMLRLPYTVSLALAALTVAIGIGVPVGVIMAVRPDHWLARLLGALTLAGQSMPTFLSGILMIMVFAVTLGWLPSSGADSASGIVMPAIALGALSMATFARMARIAVLDELSKDYVRACRARGLSIWTAVFRHVLRNAALPLVSVAALEIGNLLAGSIIVENVFAWPGVGQLALQAIQSRDFLLVQAIVLFISVTYVATSLAADLVYAWIDPRIVLARS
ncbi:MAG TPA: ABC transporter permease [Beijerinckiaceae bacterium]|nr:ABC transporter permease [Beijerinckiaceae bacterium]